MAWYESAGMLLLVMIIAFIIWLTWPRDNPNTDPTTGQPIKTNLSDDPFDAGAPE